MDDSEADTLPEGLRVNLSSCYLKVLSQTSCWPSTGVRYRVDDVDVGAGEDLADELLIGFEDGAALLRWSCRVRLKNSLRHLYIGSKSVFCNMGDNSGRFGVEGLSLRIPWRMRFYKRKTCCLVHGPPTAYE